MSSSNKKKPAPATHTALIIGGAAVALGLVVLLVVRHMHHQ